MPHVFKYSVLMAIPDRGRGERVNVGIMVFLEERIDVRLAEIAKLRALTGRDWSEYSRQMAKRVSSQFTSRTDAQDSVSSFPRIDPAFEASELAWFSISSLVEYEPRVQEILNTLVVRPKIEKVKVKASRINTEISQHLRKLRLLAKRAEPTDSHRVFRGYNIEDDLDADFAQMNGVLRVAATLDLRRPIIDIRDAALKAVVLHRARETKPRDTVTIAIFASHLPDASNIRTHLNIFKENADKSQVYNWEDASDKKKLTAFIADGLNPAGRLT